ncbi:MAG TPA: type II secretion system protein GspG [Pyrinomonadaceae bacterium]|nr:type II secretion system protein GspG [Pyrinomonadaceae bacterium]
MRSRPTLPLVSLVLILLSIGTARADLSQNQARKLISNISGVSLPRGDIHVISVTQGEGTSANVTAQIELAFRATQTGDGVWRLSEVRVGPNNWEELALIARAGNFQLSEPDCKAGLKAGDLKNSEARCLVASLFGITLPSDDVRIKEISAFGLPFGTRASALIVSLVELNFRFGTDNGKWELTDFKSGSHDWSDVVGLPQSLNAQKQTVAKAELDLIVKALNTYRRDRGSFVISEKESVVIDHLSPRYLSQVIRLDPWHRPYQYHGERDRFTLRSLGPDGKSDTSDDVVATNTNP